MSADDKAAAATAAPIRRNAPFFRAEDFVAIFRAPWSRALVLEGLTRAGPCRNDFNGTMRHRTCAPAR